jgi:hypothetical protein
MRRPSGIISPTKVVGSTISKFNVPTWDTRQLTALLAVVDEGTFSAAASRLGTPSRRSASRSPRWSGPSGRRCSSDPVGHARPGSPSSGRWSSATPARSSRGCWPPRPTSPRSAPATVARFAWAPCKVSGPRCCPVAPPVPGAASGHRGGCGRDHRPHRDRRRRGVGGLRPFLRAAARSGGALHRPAGPRRPPRAASTGRRPRRPGMARSHAARRPAAPHRLQRPRPRRGPAPSPARDGRRADLRLPLQRQPDHPGLCRRRPRLRADAPADRRRGRSHRSPWSVTCAVCRRATSR